MRAPVDVERPTQDFVTEMNFTPRGNIAESSDKQKDSSQNIFI